MDAGAAVEEFLVDVSLRSLPLAAAAWAAIGLLRVRSAAGRHAVWTLMTAAMLLMAVLGPVLPPLTLRVLRPAPAEPVAATVAIAPGPAIATARPATQPAAHPAPIDWRQAAAAIYGAGVLVFAALLVASYGFTRRLVRASRRVDCLGADHVFESDWIAVPMTVGLARPKILLPAAWREWPADKLDAAMAHERMHVRRADWAVTALAGLNRCLFWFHPLAWWLGRRLASLAEQACDDATVLELGRRECYAQTLLDMTAAVQSGRGRMVWEAMAMARTAEVRNRVERILDETREISRGWSRARWLAVAACSLPLFYMTAAVRVTAAQEIRTAPETASQPESGQPLPQPKEDAPTPAPAATPQPQSPSRIDVPGTDMERRLIHKVEPAYPPEALQAAVQGDVILETVIGADGRVKSAWPVSGNPLLRAAAQDAVLHYVYRPQGVEVGSTATVAFRLPAGAPRPPGLQDPVVIYRKEGEYSEEARRAGVDGEVAMELLVGTDGVPRGIRVLESSTPLLEKPAVDAVAQWRFKPALLNGVPVEKTAKVTMTFKLLTKPVRPPESDSPVAPPAPQTSPTAKPPAPQTTPPLLIYKRDPEYPRLAEQMGQHGTVEMVATIGTDGKVKGVKVLKGPPMLGRAAADAVMQWIYKPAMQDGVPVESEAEVELNFGQGQGSPVATPEPPGGSGNVSPPAARKEQAAQTGDTAAKPPAPHLSQAALVYKRDPEYPKEAQRAGQHGIVELVATIGVDGKVKGLKVVSGPPLLQNAAKDAVMQWVYKPTMLNGVPVENETHISISFGPIPNAAPKTPGTANPAQPAEPERKASAGQISPAVLVYRRDPEYPKIMRQRGAEGTVKLVATIGTDGHARDITVIEATDPALSDAAVEAVRHWVYKPAMVDGVPVEHKTQIVIHFKASK